MCGNRVAAPEAASVAAPFDPAEGYLDVTKRRPCRSQQGTVYLGPRGVGDQVRRKGVELLQLLDTKGSLRRQRRLRGCQELGHVDVRDRTRCVRVPPARLVGGTRVRPSATA